MKLEKQLVLLRKKEKEILNKIKENTSRMKFLCGCRKMHSIKDCEAIQTHWYTEPYSCAGGDYWNIGEVHILCPDKGKRNRILFESYEIPYSYRDVYDYNAEAQFRHIIKPLFKKITDEHLHSDEQQFEFYNNYYFDKQKEKFGIVVKPYTSKY